MKIYVKLFGNQVLPKIIKKGEWIDLNSNENVEFKTPYSNRLSKDKQVRDVKFDYKQIHLGVAMKLPAGCEAIVAPRSSLYKRKGIILANSLGVIDNCYCGNNDEWQFPAIALKETIIQEGDRICQFRIQLSQKATILQKIKWLFSNNIKLVQVDNLGNKDRKGFGSTGI